MSRSVLPSLVTLCTAQLVLLQVMVVSQLGGWEVYKDGRPEWVEQDVEEEGKFCSWQCLMFTLQWPGGFCQSLKNESSCLIPDTVNKWTIHGLWPQTQSYCHCWPMFHSDVLGLEAELKEHWPSLLATTSSFIFWRNEWRKHGATAACVEGLNSPLRYFQLCLKLRAHFDIQRFLEDAGITPSCNRTYRVVDVQQVLVPHLGNKTEIQCVKDEQGREVWIQVKISLHRNFTQGCSHHPDSDTGQSEDFNSGWRSSSGHPCRSDAPLYYLPIDHQRPLRPCD